MNNKQKIQFVKNNILSLPKGHKINSGPLFDFLSGILNNHYSSIDKIGCGILDFEIKSCHINKANKSIYINRKDGSSVNFSYYKAISGKETKKYIEVKRAFRWCIKEYTYNYKFKYFKNNKDCNGNIKCEYSGRVIKWDECHVDHAGSNSFDVIVYKFMKSHGVGLSSLEINKNGYGSKSVPEIMDQHVNKAFYDFHANLCELRCVYSKDNIRFKKIKGERFED